MPWKETSSMDERIQFIAALLKGMRMGEACRGFGISRKSGYKWLERYKTLGPQGLEDRSRAPLHTPWAISEGMAELLIDARCRHPTWGPRTLIDWLAKHHPGKRFPAPSTVGELFRRRGMVKPRRRRRRCPPHTARPALYDRPNATWCADFKGWFRVRDGRRCDPLTISDGHSRFLLCCQTVERPSLTNVRAQFERVFREYGLPDAIRTDNGPPFASTGLGGLSRLAVWWLKLGITPDRIEPAKPQQNGRHERMHRTLKAETAKPPAASLRAQQRRFDRFRQEYNEERPHQALGGDPPSSRFSPSRRTYPTREPTVEYPSHFAVRSVRTDGTIKWNSTHVYVSQALVGEPVGLWNFEQDRWMLHFSTLRLGVMDNRLREPRLISY